MFGKHTADSKKKKEKNKFGWVVLTKKFGYRPHEMSNSTQCLLSLSCVYYICKLDEPHTCLVNILPFTAFFANYVIISEKNCGKSGFLE